MPRWKDCTYTVDSKALSEQRIYWTISSSNTGRAQTSRQLQTALLSAGHWYRIQLIHWTSWSVSQQTYGVDWHTSVLPFTHQRRTKSNIKLIRENDLPYILNPYCRFIFKINFPPLNNCPLKIWERFKNKYTPGFTNLTVLLINLLLVDYNNWKNGAFNDVKITCDWTSNV